VTVCVLVFSGHICSWFENCIGFLAM